MGTYADNLRALRYHVTGAIERGEAEAIVEMPIRLLTDGTGTATIDMPTCSDEVTS